MRFTTSALPSTHIPGTLPGNMSPQMLPDAQVPTSKMRKAEIRTNSNRQSSSKSETLNSGSLISGKRIGSKSGMVSRNPQRYNSFLPKFGNNSSTKLTKSSSSLDTGRFGYRTNDSSPITIKSTSVDMFTNPLLPGEFDPVNTDLSLMKLAVNVTRFEPTGFITNGGTANEKESIARQNFRLIYSKMVSKLANNPSKAYQIAFSDINKVRIYFTSMFILLNRYYELESILAWNPPANQYNITLETMRKSFDNQAILFLKMELAEVLTLYYLPTEFVNLANYLNQTFKTGNVSDSKLFKFMSDDLAKAFSGNSTSNYIATVRDEISFIHNITDDTANGKLSNYTVAQLSGFLDKDFTFGKVYSSGLPSAANHAIHDLEAYDIFINQAAIYSNTVGSTTTNYEFPFYTGNVNTPYITHKEPNQISTFQLACQGTSGSLNILQTGLLLEETIPVLNFFGQTRNMNKLAFSVLPNGLMGVTSRLSTKNHMFNDFHFVNIGSTFPFERVSIPPSHTQIVYSDGEPIKDVATRSFSNQMFGNL